MLYAMARNPDKGVKDEDEDEERKQRAEKSWEKKEWQKIA